MTGELILANDLAELVRLREWIGRLSRDLNLDRDQVFALELTLEEIVTNVMKYAYGPGVEQPIRIGSRVQAGKLIIEVEDSGAEFNPLEVDQPSPDLGLEERKAGGLGIHFIRRLMDELAYERRQGRNVFTVAKKLASEESSAGSRERQMEVGLVKEGGAMVFSLKGRLDAVASPEVEKMTRDWLAAGETRLVGDLSELEYISSAGLRVLLMLVKSVQASGGGLCLFGLQPNVREVFAMAGFPRIIPLAETRPEALAVVAG